MMPTIKDIINQFIDAVVALYNIIVFTAREWFYGYLDIQSPSKIEIEHNTIAAKAMIETYLNGPTAAQEKEVEKFRSENLKIVKLTQERLNDIKE